MAFLIEPKFLLTAILFVAYAILLLRPIAHFMRQQSTGAIATSSQTQIAPLSFLRWIGLRLALLVPLVGVQML
ncbi:MAG: hypothetical protein F6J87_08110 [Spirulina sp. SIO3F2]|nr:hypothetical protein [Spirulina sp. SIO3F2]